MNSDYLRFNRNGRFRIMLMGDPHEGANDCTEADRAKLEDYLVLQEAALRKLRPDFVVYMGDNATGSTMEEQYKSAARLVSYCEKFRIPYNFIFGNHDHEYEITPEEQIQIYQSFDHCMTLNGNGFSDTFFDHNLTIKSSKDNADIFNLWFFDSGARAENENESYYDYIKQEQIDWYEDTVDRLADENNGKVLPSLVFQHIPVVEEYRLLKEKSFLSMLGSGVAGIHSRKGKFYVLNTKDTDVTGYMGEAPATSDINSGQFDSWKRKGDVIGAFFGHDHMNDFVGTVDGIVLGQCKLSGFRPYGDGLMQGVRVIDLDETDLSTFETEMYYYRQLVGTNCKSIKGRAKWLRDRQSVKLETSLKILGAAAVAVTGTVVAAKLIKKGKKRKL